MLEVPVYLFTGFLEGGKTKFIQGFLEDERFQTNDNTLLLVCEEGIEEYDSGKFKVDNVFIEYVDDEEELTEELLEELQKKYISMYKTRYETIRNLYDKYIKSEGRTDAEHLMYKRVVSLIDELRRDINDSRKFEKMLDEDLCEIRSLLRTELPELKKRDHILLGYLAIGFDVVSISHFMDCTTNSIYIRKSRLKNTIEKSNAEHKAIFLEIIG